MGTKKTSQPNKNKAVSEKKIAAKSLFHFALMPMFIMLLISCAVLLVYTSLYVKNRLLTEQQSSLEQNALQGTQQLNQTMSLLDHSIANMASDLELVESLSQQNVEQIKALETRFGKLLPYHLKVRIIPSGTVKVDRDTFPPLTFSAIDAIQKTEAGQTVPPEVQIASNIKVLYWAYPIKQENQHIIGTLSVCLDFGELMAKFVPTTTQNTLIQLVQKFDKGEPQILFSHGDSQLQHNSAHSEQVSSNPNWTLSYAQAPVAINSQLLDYVLLPLMLFLCGLGITVLTLRALEKYLRADGAAMLLHVEELKFGQYSRHPLFNLLFMETMNYTLERIFADDEAETNAELDTIGKNLSNKALITERPAPPDTSSAVIQASTSPSQAESSKAPEKHPKQDKIFPPNKLPSATVDDQLSLPHLPEHIFRAYDIRGIAYKELSVETVRLLGQSIGSEALDKGERSIFVGHDGRLSGPELSGALIEGLLDTGIDVIHLGVIPTPVLWFACHTQESRSGVMVTGSHNPADYNGLKIMIAGETLSEGQIINLRNRLLRQSIRRGKGQESRLDINDQYIQHIAEDVILAAPMTIVIDSGNGATGPLALKLFNELGCKTIPLFCDIDGNFPNHHPDPSQEKNLASLKQAIIDNNADLGLAFDGDGDRIGVVTPSGKVIWPDRLMMLYAKDLLVRNPGADIIFDVKCSRRLPELITSLGGRPLMWKTGHSLIKSKLKEINAALAGEMSGHIFFNDRWFGFDDALYCGARLLEILSTEGDSPETIFAALPESLATPEILIPVPEDRKFKIIQELQAKGQFGTGKINTLDGIRVDFPKAWGLVRASNTTPALTARFEAQNEEALEQIQALFQKQLLAIDNKLQLPSIK